MRRSGPLLLSWLLASSCVLSVDGYVPLDRALADSSLAGTWLHGSRERVVMNWDGDAGYELAYLDPEGKAGRFQAVLGRVGGRLVLDVWPAAPKDETSDVYRGSFLPGHVLLAVDRLGDSVRVATLDLDTLRAALAAGSVRLPHLVREESVILTGTSTQQGQGLAAYLARPGALGETAVWHRAADR